MDKNGNITLSYDTWKDGIKAPLVGMADICNIDIFDKPGVAKIDFSAQEVIGEEDVTDSGTNAIQCCAIQVDGDAVMGTDEGDVLILDELTGTVAEKNGTVAGYFRNAVEWKGYTIFTDVSTGDTTVSLSAYASSLSGDNIEYNFVSMPSSSVRISLGDFRFSKGAICVGIDDILYVASGKYVGSLTEDTTFDPTDNGTYTWNNQALDLPDGYVIDAIWNFNDYLMISAGNPDTREQQIFPWDRVSASYDYPTPLNNGVAAQATAYQNLAYFLDGTRGQFRVTNRAIVDKVVEFENITFPNRDDGLAQKQGAIANIDDVFLVGVSNDDDGVYPIGVYKVKGNAYTRQTLSEGLDGSTKEIKIHFIEPFKYNNYLVSWENINDLTFGVDEFGLDGYRCTGYTAFMESPLYQPGLVLRDKSYQQMEIVLAKPLATGQGIKVYYRENLSDSWTEITTQEGDRFDFATYGAVAKANLRVGAIDKTTLQLKVEMTTGASSTTTPELISVKLF